MLRSYKYRIYPTKEQSQELDCIFGSCRFVYNLALETKRWAWITANKNVTWIDLVNQLTELKHTNAIWLKVAPSQCLVAAIRNLDRAYSNFFRGKGYPKFKSKYSKQSIKFPAYVKVSFDMGIIKLPKLTPIKCVFHRKFQGVVKSTNVSKTATGKYFVSILVENQNELPKKQPVEPETTIGLDVGIKTFATLSNGDAINMPRFLRNNLKRLRVEQRKLNRRFKKGAKVQSKNYCKQKQVVGKLHERIRNQREDFLHKASDILVRGFDCICVEQLYIKGMLQNRRNALAIAELGWRRFFTMLEYKANWHGKNLLFIGRFEPSSKTCSHCNSVNDNLRQQQRTWNCPTCGAELDRDINAAINIKEFGLRNKPLSVNVSQ